jgi:FHA domain-containing protein/uncharacterized protein DUF1707
MGGSAAEAPTSPDAQPVPGLRASDAERDEVVGKLKEEFAAGRLSHDTFLFRMNAVLDARHQAELPPLVADLPAPAGPAVLQPGSRAASQADHRENPLVGWLRAAWSRRPRSGASQAAVAGSGPRTPPPGGGSGPSTPAPGGVVRRLTAGMPRAADVRLPVPLQFPRGAGSFFSIGRDASCDLAIADMTVSRMHARLERTPDGWLLTDLASTNGTRVNGWRVRDQVTVRAGDLVSFGDAKYSLSAAEGS